VAENHERERQEKGDAVRHNEKTLAESRESLMRTIARISEARNQVHQIEIAVEKCEFYLSKLGESTRKAAASRDSALSLMAEWDRNVSAAEKALTGAQGVSTSALAQRDGLSSRRDAMRQSLSSARDVISQTTYRIDSLRTLLTSLESQDEEVRRAVLELIPNAASATEAVRATEGFEAALDTLLRDMAKAVVVENADTAVEAVTRLRQRGAGRGAFIRLDYEPNPGASRPGDAGFSIVGQGPVAAAVRAAIPEAYIVGDLRAAMERAQQRPHATFITLEGDLARGPLVVGGKSEGATPGVFSLKRQLSDLEAHLGSEETRASGIANDLRSIEEELRAADDARILAEEHARTAEEELRQRRSSRERVGVELERLEKDLAVASEERSLYEDEKDALLGRRNAAIEELHRLEENERNTQDAIRRNEEELHSIREAFEEITETSSRARVDLETAIGNVNSIQREHENVSRIVISLNARTAQLRADVESLTARRTETEQAGQAARAQLETAMTDQRTLSEQRVLLEAEVADLEASVQQLETRAHASRDTWNSARQSLFDAERRLDRARSAFDLLREQISLDLHAGIDALADVIPPASDEERSALEADVARLTDQLEKIGPVNVLAIEEHRELEEREIFLRTQRDDLVQAIESLRSTIRKINVTSRELFRDAFNAVNDFFSETFTSLFGGGQARMQLLDEDDVLESGIELIAQPPGKKNQSIALLSGGERALTALALLFAIFRYKPSPFCILDEVDAPLDEVNNERFVRLVRDMSRDTQFIVITHSRRTMEAADVLYGVTMEEAGCSRLVSVSFADLEA